MADRFYLFRFYLVTARDTPERFAGHPMRMMSENVEGRRVCEAAGRGRAGFWHAS